MLSSTENRTRFGTRFRTWPACWSRTAGFGTRFERWLMTAIRNIMTPTGQALAPTGLCLVTDPQDLWSVGRLRPLSIFGACPEWLFRHRREQPTLSHSDRASGQARTIESCRRRQTLQSASHGNVSSFPSSVMLRTSPELKRLQAQKRPCSQHNVERNITGQS